MECKYGNCGTSCDDEPINSVTSGTGDEPVRDVNNPRALIRSSLARSLYDRMLREDQLRKFDHSKWYFCDIENFEDSDLKEKFVQQSYDDETKVFVEKCYEKSDWFFTHLFNAIASSLLRLFMSFTSVNGLLKRGSMFVFSDAQLNKICDMQQFTRNEYTSLLDLGAGDGKVTETMAKYFNETFATEVSLVMRKILSRKGYTMLDALTWSESDISFDFISCLNLLDRCDKPMTMLTDIRDHLKPDGKILIALVLPLNQYVEYSSSHKPIEIIPISGNTIEQQIESFDKDILRPIGLSIIKWSKLPYLCEGDLDLSLYWLSDFIFLIEKSKDKSYGNVAPQGYCIKE